MTTGAPATTTPLKEAIFQITGLAEPIIKECQSLEARAGNMTVTDATSLAYVNETLVVAKRMIKVLEDERVARTKPLNDKKTAIDRVFGVPKAILEKVRDTADAAVRAWLRAEDARIEAEKKKFAEEQEAERLRAAEEAKTLSAEIGTEVKAEDLFVPQAPPPSTAPVPGKIVGVAGSTSAPKVWLGRVVNEAEFIKYAGEHWDDPFVRSCIEIKVTRFNVRAKEVKGPSTYPGVEFFEDFSLTSR